MFNSGIVYWIEEYMVDRHSRQLRGEDPFYSSPFICHDMYYTILWLPQLRFEKRREKLDRGVEGDPLQELAAAIGGGEAQGQIEVRARAHVVVKTDLIDLLAGVLVLIIEVGLMDEAEAVDLQPRPQFLRHLPQDGLLNEGIDSLSAADVQDFMARGWTCRLIAGGSKAADGRIAAYVEPVLLSAGEAECAVLRNNNLARYVGQNSGLITMIGQGAGRYPTASAVLRDLTGIAQGECAMFPPDVANGAADNSGESHVYYVRLPKADADKLPVRQVLSEEDGILRILTEEITVQEMHETAADLRKEGCAVFFAAVREA